MSSPFRYAHLPEEELHEIFLDIILGTPPIRNALVRAQELALPNWRLVSGALYNVVWNHLTGREALHGVKDIDLFYFDPDTSWHAEDAIIRSATGFAPQPPVEIRNQARVHLWYAEKFNHAIPPFETVEQAIDAFTTKTHCVGLRLEADGTTNLHAPHGLRNIFAMREVPNPVRPNRLSFEAKATRSKSSWRELTLIRWRILPWLHAGARE